MLRLNEEAQRLTSTFLTYRNDIDIYTEDEEKDKEFYKVLFNRLLGNGMTINDITPLGSKDIVMRRCAEDPDNGRKKIFIIDGDMSVIHGKDTPEMNNLFVLDAYCIENFLFDKKTIIHFIYLNCATKSIEAIEEEVEFEKWLSEYSDIFIELFILFAIADFFEKPYTLFNANKYHIKSKSGYSFSKDLVAADIDQIKSEILESIDLGAYNAKYEELKTQWTNCIENLFTLVSGKDYLIPILLIKTQCFKKSQALPSLEEVKMSLVHFCSLDRLNNLKEAIETL